MAVRTRAELNSDADTFLSDNSAQEISAADVRQRIKDAADSALFPEDVGSAAFESASAFATSTQGGKADTAIQTASRAATSVIGRSANSSGNAADIAASSNDTIFARVSNALGFFALTFAMIASTALATASEVLSWTASKLLSAAAAESAMAWQTLTDGTTITVNHNNGRRYTVTTSTARTITASNLKDGHQVIIVFTGNHLHSYSSTYFDFTEVGGVPTSVWARYKVAGTVRNGKVRIYSVVETAA